MGYKSVLRSVSSSLNKSIKEQERHDRQEARLLAKIQKKYNQANEKLTKIISTLDDIYAKGKINKEEYNDLLKRKSDMTIDLILFGKTPFISLAKRYITGKIDKDEYEEMQKDILPDDFFKEKQFIPDSIAKIIEDLDNFRKSIKETDVNKCQVCEVKKTFLKRLKVIENVKLCKQCRSKLKNIQRYRGFVGKYFISNPMTIGLNDIDNKINIDIKINNNALL